MNNTLWALIRFESGGSIMTGSQDDPVLCGIFTTLEQAKAAALKEFETFPWGHWVQWAQWKAFPCALDQLASFKFDDPNAVHIVDNVPQPRRKQ